MLARSQWTCSRIIGNRDLIARLPDIGIYPRKGACVPITIPFIWSLNRYGGQSLSNHGRHQITTSGLER
jgi:hypothetical protein